MDFRLMIELCRRTIRKLVVAAFAVLWLATLACAETVAILPAHPGHPPMPCCRHSGEQGAQCSPDQCPAQAFKKTDGRRAAETPAVHRAALPRLFPHPSLASIRQLIPGLFYRAAVFRLKDDLRI